MAKRRQSRRGQTCWDEHKRTKWNKGREKTCVVSLVRRKGTRKKEPTIR